MVGTKCLTRAQRAPEATRLRHDFTWRVVTKSDLRGRYSTVYQLNSTQPLSVKLLLTASDRPSDRLGQHRASRHYA